MPKPIRKKKPLGKAPLDAVAKAPRRPSNGLKPFWASTKGDIRLFAGDVASVSRRLPRKSVHTIVTSPPYWGLRDYGTATWVGGDERCDHKRPSQTPQLHLDRNGNIGRNNTNWDHRHEMSYEKVCGKCGAKRIDDQLGIEPTPEEFVDRMVAIFSELREVLRDDGTCWVNLGDCYGPKLKYKRRGLVGVPWMFARAMIEDGWMLIQDIIWAKPSPMPESVTNRCTKAHEYIFLFSKEPGYFYDAEAIKDKSIDPEALKGKKLRDLDGDKFVKSEGGIKGFAATRGFSKIKEGKTYETKNKRSVWTVTSESYEGAHFATFPTKLIEPCVKAGAPEKCCGKCGKPWERLTEKTQLKRKCPNDYVKRTGEPGTGNSCANSAAGVSVKTLGWEPTCSCGAPPVGGIVLDPFVGSGTTAEVAIRNDRRAWGIDLNENYLREQAVVRIEGTLLSIPQRAGEVTSSTLVLEGEE